VWRLVQSVIPVDELTPEGSAANKECLRGPWTSRRGPLASYLPNYRQRVGQRRVDLASPAMRPLNIANAHSAIKSAQGRGRRFLNCSGFRARSR
jgi:hypothetical protein